VAPDPSGKILFTKFSAEMLDPNIVLRAVCTSGTPPAEFPTNRPAPVPFRGMDVEDLWGHEA
jgi:hypothetical protein